LAHGLSLKYFALRFVLSLTTQTRQEKQGDAGTPATARIDFFAFCIFPPQTVFSENHAPGFLNCVTRVLAIWDGLIPIMKRHDHAIQRFTGLITMRNCQN